MKTKDDTFTEDCILLKCFAHGYGCAIHSHVDWQLSEEQKDERNYLMAQADFVKVFPESVVEFLREYGVNKIDPWHLQYFFSVLRVYEPYELLWMHCYEEMGTEQMLPTNARETLRRMINTKNTSFRLLRCVVE